MVSSKCRYCDSWTVDLTTIVGLIADFCRLYAYHSSMAALTRPRRASAADALAAGAYNERFTSLDLGISAGKRVARVRVRYDDAAASDDELEGHAVMEKPSSSKKQRIESGLHNKPHHPMMRQTVRERATQDWMQLAERPESAQRLSATEDTQQLQQWVQEQRNANTARTYDSNMRQFVRWAHGEGSAGLIVPIDVDRPSDTNVAAYMRYMVMKLHRPMTTVGVHLSAIANHVRFATGGDSGYDNPTKGPIVKAMRSVLTDHAPRPGGQQKRAMSWDDLRQLMTVIGGVAGPPTISASLDSVQWMARRDMTMILMGFFFLLRRSEIVRMKRKDVSLLRMESKGVDTKVLQVYVNEKSKNDYERKGHMRVAAERSGQTICVIRSLADYVVNCERSKPCRIASPEDPLFPRLEGGPMSEDTPNGRLQHWLGVAQMEQPTSYGFHSLRAGAATDAYRNGATEEWIKEHGNWKSDAVKIYIRKGIEERLATSAVLGQGKSRAVAAAAGFSL